MSPTVPADSTPVARVLRRQRLLRSLAVLAAALPRPLLRREAGLALGIVLCTLWLAGLGIAARGSALPTVVLGNLVGAGKLCHDVVAVMGGIEVHRRMPISLTFDHRACTGGEAARFLKALLDDLAQPH